MNRVALISFKISIWILLVINIAAAAMLIFSNSWQFQSSLALSNSAVLAVAILVILENLILIFGFIAGATLCVLSNRRWQVIAGAVMLLLAGGYAGYYALRFSLFITFSLCFIALSSSALLLAIFAKRRLDSLSNNTSAHALVKPALFVTIAGLFIAMAGFWLHPDESLDPNFHRFYTDNHKSIADSENAAIGIAGLNAPIGSNFMEAGLPAFKNAQINVSAMLKQSEATPVLAEPANKIIFVGSVEELNCWIGLPDTGDVSPKCASEKRLNEILRANTVLLSRYWQVARMPHVRGIYPNGDLFLKINRMIAAEVQLKLRHGRHEEAYQEWRDNDRFINRMIGEETDWIAKAIFAVANSFNQASAEALIHSYKDIVALHGEELMTMFEPSDLTRWNLPGTLRAEYEVWSQFVAAYEPQFWFHPNFIRNSWLHSSLVYLDAASSAPNLANTDKRKILIESGGFSSWSNDYLKDPLNAVLAHGCLINPLADRKFELLRSFHIHDAKQKALILTIHIKRNSLKDNEIADYLASVEPKLRNPFTGKPMTWDAKKRAIAFVVPKTSNSGSDLNVETKL